MQTTKKDNKAISAALSTIIFASIIITAAVLLYGFVNTDLENWMESSSAETIELSLVNVEFNQTCITIRIVNSGEKEAVLEKVYINKELRAFNLLDHDLKIAAHTTKNVYVFGSYTPGCKFDVKIVFETGHTLRTLEKYS